MSTILQENEVTLDRLAEHLEDAGFGIELLKSKLALHSRNGLSFHIFQDSERKFLVLNTYLPVKTECDDALMVANSLNDRFFMGKFSLDNDNDLGVSYAMTYERGLILAQFSRIVNRFASLLDHIVGTFDKDDKIFALKRVPVDELPVPQTLQ